MKYKISLVSLSFLLVITCSAIPINATNSEFITKEELGLLEENSNNTHPVDIGSREVTEQAKEQGEDYAQLMSDQSSMQRMGGEVWKLTSSATVEGYGAKTAKFGGYQAKGTSATRKVNGEVSVGAIYKNVTIGAKFGASFTWKITGPSDNTKLSNGIAATHRAYFVVNYGTLMKYTFRVTDKYTGRYIRTVTSYQMANTSSTNYTQLVSIHASKETVTVQNRKGNKVRTYSSKSSYQKTFASKGTGCTNAFEF